MDAQPLPIVPFGKYKGQPITNLLNDTKTLDWYKQNGILQKYPIIYNICVNQTITTNNPHSKTPEHNRLQNMFLQDENVEILLKKVFDINSKSGRIIHDGEIKFEGIFNWDLIVKGYKWFLCDCWDDDTKDSCYCEIYKKYVERYKIPKDEEDLKLDELYCEIKPCLGDDYPAVLRKMNTQIELTNNYAKKHNEEKKQQYKTEYDEDWQMRKYWNEHKGSYDYCLRQEYIKPVYVLIIKDFNSTTTTKEQLITIFNQSRIKVVFTDDLFTHNNLQVNTTIEQIEQPIMDSSQEQEIIKTEENNSLGDNLLETQQKLLEEQEKNRQLEEKIRQLEEEIQLLKTQKQAKSIKDYFGKK